MGDDFGEKNLVVPTDICGEVGAFQLIAKRAVKSHCASIGTISLMSGNLSRQRGVELVWLVDKNTQRGKIITGGVTNVKTNTPLGKV